MNFNYLNSKKSEGKLKAIIILFNDLKYGFCIPCSHFAIVVDFLLIKFPNCNCVNPFFSLKSFIFLFMLLQLISEYSMSGI